MAAIVSLIEARQRRRRWLFLAGLMAVGIWVACGGGGGSGPVTVGSSGGSSNGSSPPPPAAPLTFSPSSIDFGQVRLGTVSTAQTATVSNTSNASVQIDVVGVNGAYSNDFQTGSICTEIAAGANCPIDVMFAPSALGKITGTLSRVRRRQQPSVDRRERNWYPVPSNFSAASITFGLQGLGSSSARRRW